MASSEPRRIRGNALMLGGCVLLLITLGACATSQQRGEKLQAQSRLTPTLTAVDAPPSASLVPAWTATVAPATAPPTTAPTAAPTEGAPGTAATPTASAIPSGPPPATDSPGPSPTRTPAGPPVRIVIQDLSVDARVVEMGWRPVESALGLQSEWIIPENEAGHHLNSATMAAPGNIVISGHNNAFGRVFEAISFAWDGGRGVSVDDYTLRSDLLNGRSILLYDAVGREYTYVIAEFLLLMDTGVPLDRRIENARFIQPTAQEQLTLVTCWPPTSNTHRLIVIAYPDDRG